jgi:sarcosine oxidase
VNKITVYDTIVIGLGAMGSATLYQMAKRGAKVLGIDQFNPPHDLGSTHGETRITRLAIGEGAVYMPLVRRSHKIWQELEAVTGEKLMTLCGGYIICPKQGGAQFHGGRDFVEESVALATRYGIPHDVVSGEVVAGKMPALNTQSHEHAYYEPTGGVVNPERAVATQLQQAAIHGAMIHANEKVLSVLADGERVRVKTDRGEYVGEKVVLSAGAWARDFLPASWQTPLAVYRQVIYWFEAEDLTPFLAENLPFVIWIGDKLEDYFCLFPVLPEGTQAVKMMTEEYLENVHPDDVDRTVHPHEIARMVNYFIPQKVRGVTSNLVKAKVCLYTVTPDEHFLIDWHPEQKNVLVVSPCSGHGFKHSAGIGEAISQLILTGESDIDLSPFAFKGSWF